MPTFDTPEPISATIDLAVGDVRISAGDRATTVVDVQPSDAVQRRGPQGRRADPRRVRRRAAAGQGAEAALLAAAQRRRRRSTSRSSCPPARSVNGTARAGGLPLRRPARRLPDQDRPRPIQLDQADALNLKSGAGDITVDARHGRTPRSRPARARCALRELDGSAVIKNSNGDTWVGVGRAATCALNAANGSIAVDVAHASVVAKSANGDVRLGEVVRGSVVLETKIGDLEVGIREGTAAWLDVNARARHACTTPSTPPTPPRRRPRPSRCARARPSANIVDPAGPVTMTLRDRRSRTGLRKSFGDHLVLDGIDLDVAEGTIFALLGPNGAGKTTIVQILSTLIGADGGDAARRRPRRRPRPRRGPRRDRRHRPVLGRRQPAHRRGEPDPDGRPAPPRPGRGPPARRRAARALRPRRGGRASRPPPTPAACGAGSTSR